MVQNVIIVDKFELAAKFNRDTRDIVDSILAIRYGDDDIDEDEDFDGLDCGDTDVDSVASTDLFADYNRHEINEILDETKPKKYKVALGKATVLLEHTQLFCLTLDRKAYTFLRHFTENYA